MRKITILLFVVLLLVTTILAQKDIRSILEDMAQNSWPEELKNKKINTPPTIEPNVRVSMIQGTCTKTEFLDPLSRDTCKQRIHYTYKDVSVTLNS